MLTSQLNRLLAKQTQALSVRNFSYFTNLHYPPAFYVDGKKFISDYDIEEYRPQVQAFVTRRRTTKREVPPRAAIMKDMGDKYSTVYYQQKLSPGEVLLDEA